MPPDAHWQIQAKDREARTMLRAKRRQVTEGDALKKLQEAYRAHGSLNQAFEDQDYRRAGELADQLVATLKDLI